MDSKTEKKERNSFTLRKSRSHITSGLGSPTTSQSMTTVSPSTASVDNGFVTKSGSLEYLEKMIIYYSDYLYIYLYNIALLKRLTVYPEMMRS